VRPEFARQRAGKGEHGALRGDVRQHARHALVGGARGDVDDLAGLARDHVRRDVLDHQERPAGIDCHHAIPRFGVPFVEIARMQRRIKRGVVDQDVDLAEAFDGLRDQILDRRLVADVEGDAGDVSGAVLFGDLGRDVLAVGDVGDHDAGAFRGERLRIVRADTLGAAGDDGDFACKPCHGRSPIRHGPPTGSGLGRPGRGTCPGHPRLYCFNHARRGCPQQVRA
jgi:hypothetical protein